MSHYKQLLREHIKDPSNDGERKKRRRKQNISLLATQDDLSDSPTTDFTENNDFIANDNLQYQPIPDFEDDFDDLEDEFEDIDIGTLQEQSNYSFSDGNSGPEDETLTIQLTQPQQPLSTKRKVEFISKQERKLRLIIHQWYLVTMICHGTLRNRWCNDSYLRSKLRNSISPDIIDDLDSIRHNHRISMVNAVRFTEIVRKLMTAYSRKFKITRQGLVRKNWNQLLIPQTNIERNVRFDKFLQHVLQFQGSRDVGAQGFVALLRSLGMKVRLIFSLQPPDFTMVTKLPAINTSAPINTNKDSFVDSKRQFLAPKPVAATYKFANSEYPIFWAEVWNKYNQKWLCVDPIVLKVVEHPPMRKKSSFEPPWSDSTNNLVYVIAFDAKGGIKDVTRRYAQQFNSKTTKKRISSKSEELNNWYNKVINTFPSPPMSKITVLELKEFHQRDLTEGMPNNLSGFKDHPIYAVDSQLNQTQIIYPKDETTQVGTFRVRTTSELIPVFKRSAVHLLRSAKAWYLRGRVLKVGVQPLRVKPAKNTRQLTEFEDQDGDEEATRLYGEFQTKLYIPPPITNGRVPKNSYGNIDVYVPTMVPEGGYIVEAPMKLAMEAARILEIDYAKAVVGFDFHNSKRVPSIKEGGILVGTEYKEAMDLMVQQLVQEQEIQRSMEVELRALAAWKVFLTRLRINKRLEREHGVVESDDSGLDEVISDDYISDMEPGGFLVTEPSGDDISSPINAIENDISGFPRKWLQTDNMRATQNATQNAMQSAIQSANSSASQDEIANSDTGQASDSGLDHNGLSSPEDYDFEYSDG